MTQTNTTQNKQDQIVKEIMQAGFDVSMGGNPDESEEWNKLWGEKEYDLVVAEYTNKLSELISQTRQEAVEDVLEEVIKYLEEMEIVLTPEQSGKHNYDQMENEYFKGRNIGILRCIDLLKSLSQEKK